MPKSTGGQRRKPIRPYQLKTVITASLDTGWIKISDQNVFSLRQYIFTLLKFVANGGDLNIFVTNLLDADIDTLTSNGTNDDGLNDYSTEWFHGAVVSNSIPVRTDRHTGDLTAYRIISTGSTAEVMVSGA